MPKQEIKKVEIVPYDPNWPVLFEKEAAALREFLGEACLEVHHIGSTAVPDLSAKQDIDMVLIIDDLERSLQLEKIGFSFRGEWNIPLRYGFSKNTESHKVNLHVTEKDHGFKELNLLFRDYLRMHENIKKQYEALKLSLAANPENHVRGQGRFAKYTLEKNTFIKSVLNQAGYTGMIVNFATHDEEWKSYHRIKENEIFVRAEGITYDKNHPTLTDPNHFHFILYKGIEVVSIAHVEFLDQETAALRSLATDSAHKKKGYASHLLKTVEKWTHLQGRSTLKTHTHLSAEKFYRDHGYQDMEFDDTPLTPEIVDLGKKLRKVF